MDSLISVQIILRLAGAPFYPSSPLVIEKMLTLAGVNSDSVVHDLGCGDGRILVTAARDCNAKTVVGIERNQKLYDRALRMTVHLKNVQVVCADYDDVDLSEANVITIYQSSSENARLKRKFLDELPKGTTIVSHDFGIPGWHAKQFHILTEGRHGFRIIVYMMGFHTP